MGYHFAPIRMAPFRESQKEQVLVRMSRGVKPLCIASGEVMWYSRYEKQYKRFLRKLKIELLYQPAITLPGIYSKEKRISMAKRCLCAYANPSTNNSSQDVEATYVSMSQWWMQNCGVYMDNGILRSLHKGRRPAITRRG